MQKDHAFDLYGAKYESVVNNETLNHKPCSSCTPHSIHSRSRGFYFSSKNVTFNQVRLFVFEFTKAKKNLQKFVEKTSESFVEINKSKLHAQT